MAFSLVPIVLNVAWTFGRQFVCICVCEYVCVCVECKFLSSSSLLLSVRLRRRRDKSFSSMRLLAACVQELSCFECVGFSGCLHSLCPPLFFMYKCADCRNLKLPHGAKLLSDFLHTASWLLWHLFWGTIRWSSEEGKGRRLAKPAKKPFKSIWQECVANIQLLGYIYCLAAMS